MAGHGQTPYGESRGGHVPGAKHLFYKALVSSDGKVLPRDQIHRKLTEIGVKENDEVVSYCTGGVRAGFVTVLLNDAGIAARNYAGSMWECFFRCPQPNCAPLRFFWAGPRKSSYDRQTGEGQQMGKSSRWECWYFCW